MLEDDILALPRVIYNHGTLMAPILPYQADIPAYVLLTDVLACLKHMREGQFTLYEIACETPNHFYVGITQDVAHRFSQHQKKKGAFFTQAHGARSVKVIGVFEDKWSAIKAESAHVAELNKIAGAVVAGAARNKV